MKVLVTGASGYVGNKLAYTLADIGYHVHAIVRNEQSAAYLNHPCIQIFKADILDKQGLNAAMKNCEQVYHTAGFVKLWSKDREIFYKTNVGGTINVMEAAVRHNVKKLVYTSSCGVWNGAEKDLVSENDPRIHSFDNDYDLSKHLAEKAVKDYSSKGIFTVIVNPPRIFGPGIERSSSDVNRFIRTIIKNRISFFPWHLNVKANYAYIDDVVNGHILAMKNGLGGERYILGGHNVSYSQLIESIKKCISSKKFSVRVPMFLLKSVARFELLRSKLSGHEPSLTPAMLKRFMIEKNLDCSKAVKQLHYRITDFDEAVNNTVHHLTKMK